jgi:hypothetical protein
LSPTRASSRSCSTFTARSRSRRVRLPR